MNALGTADQEFVNGILRQLANAGSHGEGIDEGGLNFLVSVVNGIEPRDQLETMLAAQMAAVHVATMTFARRLAHVETVDQQDSAERDFNKLTRTFATQMEALKRRNDPTRYRPESERGAVRHQLSLLGRWAQVLTGAAGGTSHEATRHVVLPSVPSARTKTRAYNTTRGSRLGRRMAADHEEERHASRLGS